MIILCAEDDADDRLLIRAALSAVRPADEVVFVDAGEDVLEFLRRQHVNTGRPISGVAVLLDLNLRGMGGLDTLRELRADADFAAVPVIVLTGSAEAEATRSYESGADRHIVKPMTFSSLIDELRDLPRHALREHQPATPGGWS